jgi:hypothetical protein
MDIDKQTPEIGRGKPGPGRPKGLPNKMTTLLKDAILLAAEEAGGKGGLVGYLKRQALENPGPFMALLGKVLPTQLVDEHNEPVQVTIFKNIYEDAARNLYIDGEGRRVDPNDDGHADGGRLAVEVLDLTNAPPAPNLRITLKRGGAPTD